MTETEEPAYVPSTPIASLLGAGGWVVVASGLFHGAYVTAETRELASMLPGLGVVALGLLLVGVAEVLTALFAIERNTRELADEARRAMDES
ncbi:MAG: hypothetical protein ACF8XB_03015 [Planctomycetota bacterium JB042]